LIRDGDSYLYYIHLKTKRKIKRKVVAKTVNSFCGNGMGAEVKVAGSGRDRESWRNGYRPTVGEKQT